MPGTKQLVPIEIRNSVRRDFVLGKGSITSLSKTYKVARQTISAWIEYERWKELQELFASEDELLVCKKQLVNLNKLIESESEAEPLLQLWKCKQAAFEIFATIAGLPRRPIGKLEKPKDNRLIERLEQAARAQQESDIVAESKPSQVVELPVIETDNSPNVT